ncbi:hypothetical protein KIPB_008264, partial [Kipferlia bialata]|eukprot:g8264.t1
MASFGRGLPSLFSCVVDMSDRTTWYARKLELVCQETLGFDVPRALVRTIDHISRKFNTEVDLTK